MTKETADTTHGADSEKLKWFEEDHSEDPWVVDAHIAPMDMLHSLRIGYTLQPLRTLLDKHVSINANLGRHFKECVDFKLGTRSKPTLDEVD